MSEGTNDSASGEPSVVIPETYISLIDDLTKKNVRQIRCQRCPCLVMSPMQATYVKKEASVLV